MAWARIKGMQFFALAIAICLSQPACGASRSGFRNGPANLPNQVSNEQVENMKIRIKFEDKVLTATLRDSKTARDFVSQLPLTLTLEDYASTEKISDLPKRLSTEGAAPGFDPSGDIAYYEPWGNLAVFYKDFRYSSGLVSLGRLDTGVDLLARSHYGVGRRAS